MQYLIVVGDKTIADGPCFLKAVFDVAYTNTRSSSVVIKAMLASLDDYMKTLKDSNIETSNQHVKDDLKKLAAAGESSDDLLMNLFKAYQCTKDKQFIAWVSIKRSIWYEGTIQLDPNGNQLMQLMESYYKDTALGGEWMNLSKDEQ